MYVVGLNIGYSNVKIAEGPRGDLPRLILRPAGAAPRERLGERIGAEEEAGSTTGAAADRPVPVDLDGVLRAAAIEPERFEDWQRPLHEDYPATPSYHALALAALLLTGQRAIDVVVIGLPVAQAGDPRRRERLKRLLTGRHGSGEVGEVRVVPQPIGAYLDLVYAATDEKILERIETGADRCGSAGRTPEAHCPDRPHREPVPGRTPSVGPDPECPKAVSGPLAFGLQPME
jgi:plasmid segregation protein ParM